MIAKQQNVACKAVADQAAMNPLWADYSTYCLLREEGMRQEAFNRLSRFIDSAAKWDFAEQKEFVLWLCGLMDSVRDADYGPFPQPVRDRIFRPFFDAWISREPTNDDALVLKARYLGDHWDYAAALAVNPDNQRARRALALDCIGDIDHATHHLPEYFIGEPRELKQVAEQAREHIGQITDPQVSALLTAELAASEGLLNDWIAYQQAPIGGFDDWCLSRGRKYKWVKAYCYDR